MPSSTSTPWLLSRELDLILIVGPALLAVGGALVLPPGLELSPVAWLVVVLGIDVAHVYGSIWRTYAQPGEVRRRPGLYVGMPVAVWAGLVGLAAVAPDWFWTVLAYLAVYHFIRQQWGIAALYRLREGLPGRGWGARLEKWSHYALAGWPVLWWHAHLPQPFAWFTESDFLRGLPEGVVWALLPVAVGVVLALGVRRARSGRWSPGRDLWLLVTAAVWGVGILGVHGDAAFSLPNVVHHGVPYLALVWFTGHRLQRSGRATAWNGRPFQAKGLLWFLVPLLALAFVEEWGWDRLMWFDHPELFGPSQASLDPGATALVLGTLSVPQVVHYILDGYIWRMDGSNPGLREAWSAPAPEVPR